MIPLPFSGDADADANPEKAATNAQPVEPEPTDASKQASPTKTKQEEQEEGAPDGASLCIKASVATRNAAKAKGTAFLPVQEPSSLFSHLELLYRAEEVLNFNTVDELEEHKTQTKKYFGTVAQLKDSIAKGASKLNMFLENIKREQDREVKKAQTKKEKEAVAKAKAAAKQAAETVKKEEKEVPPIFAGDIDAKMALTVVTDADMEKEGFSFDATKPALIRTALVEKEWLASSKVQMAMSAYGGQYKSQTTVKDQGKGQIPMRPKNGKEETDTLVSKLLSKLKLEGNIASLPGQDEALLKETWLYGYAPSRSFVSPTPQGLPMIKILAMGETSTFLFKLADLAKAFKDKGKTLTHDTAESILNQKAADMQEGLCNVHFCKQQKHDILYVPGGYLAVERSGAAVLIYGMRKSFCLKGEASSYAAVVQYVKDCGKDAGRYEKVLESLTAIDSTGPA